MNIHFFLRITSKLAIVRCGIRKAIRVGKIKNKKVMPRPNECSVLDCLAVLMHYSIHMDGERDQNEINVAISKLKEWVPGEEELAIPALEKAVGWLANSNVGEEVIFCLDTIKSRMNKDALTAVLSDLKSIFEADGKVTDEERKVYKIIVDHIK
jgi:hypothetical protein